MHEKCMAKGAFVKDRLPGFKFVYKHEPTEEILRLGFAIYAEIKDTVLEANSVGFKEYDVFLDLKDLFEKDLPETMGKCRYLAGSFEELEMLDKVVADFEMKAFVGLKIVPPGFPPAVGDFKKEEVHGKFSELNKRYEHLEIIGMWKDIHYSENPEAFLPEKAMMGSCCLTAIPTFKFGFIGHVVGNIMDMDEENQKEYIDKLMTLREYAEKGNGVELSVM